MHQMRAEHYCDITLWISGRMMVRITRIWRRRGQLRKVMGSLPEVLDVMSTLHRIQKIRETFQNTSKQ